MLAPVFQDSFEKMISWFVSAILGKRERGLIRNEATFRRERKNAGAIAF